MIWHRHILQLQKTWTFDLGCPNGYSELNNGQREAIITIQLAGMLHWHKEAHYILWRFKKIKQLAFPVSAIMQALNRVPKNVAISCLYWDYFINIPQQTCENLAKCYTVKWNTLKLDKGVYILHSHSCPIKRLEQNQLKYLKTSSGKQAVSQNIRNEWHFWNISVSKSTCSA